MIESQSNGVSQASAAVEEMLGNIASVNSSVEKMAASFGALESNASDGINHQKVLSEQVTQIAEQAVTLQDANKAISAVASQTNLLAMNAAMEEQQEGSHQIVDALKIMNDSTSEVKTASHEMSIGNQQILNEIHNLQDATQVIKDGMNEMSIGAREMNGTSAVLAEISSKVGESIDQIGAQVDQFQV